MSAGGAFRGAVTLAAILLLSACALATDAPQPEAPHAIQLNCSGAFSDQQDCVEKAQSLCGPQGYTVLSDDAPAHIGNSNVNFHRDTPNTPVGDRHFFGTQRGLLIVCGQTPLPADPQPKKPRRKKAK